MPKISLAAAIARAKALTDRFDFGATDPNGTIVVYNGAVPVDEAAALAGGNLELVVFDGKLPMFPVPVAGAPGAVATASAIDPMPGLITEVATFFRVYNRDGDCEMQGIATDAAGNGELKLDSVNITQNVTVSIIEFKIKEPKA